VGINSARVGKSLTISWLSRSAARPADEQAEGRDHSSCSLVVSPAARPASNALISFTAAALRALTPLQVVSERMCVGDREGARRGEGFRMVIPSGAAADDCDEPAVTLCLAVFCQQDEWQDAV
jgi:hypothetical protein